MSDSAVIAQLAATGAEQVAATAFACAPWIALAVGAAMLAGRWLLRRGKRTGPLLALPPEVADDTLGDDVIEMLHGWDSALERLVREADRG